MRAILLLAATTTVTHCHVTTVDTEIKQFFSSRQIGANTNEDKQQEIENRPTHFLLRHNFSGIMGTLMKQPRPSIREQKETEQKLKEIAEWSEYDRNLNNSTTKFSGSKRRIGHIMFQSDIVVTNREAEKNVMNIEMLARSKRQVLKDDEDENSTWHGGVFYTFNTSAQDKVVVITEDGSWSSVGRLGGDQLLSLDSSATEGSAVHEIGHVLGLYHTMARYDRNHYIRVVMENVDPLFTNNFKMMDENDVDVYGLTYDYGSVMHYDELSGSVNGQRTMIAVDSHYQKTMGSGIISFSDIFMMNEHYGCNAICNESTSAMCKNEGFPHPRNCSKCICPSGYGGTVCDQRPPGCGKDLVAVHEKQLLIDRVGRGLGLRDKFIVCNYMITAPEGKKVEVNVQSISHGYDQPGCRIGGVEIKAQKDKKLTGYRFCSVNGTSGPVVSSYNRLPIILFNRLSLMHVTITYRYTD